MISDFVLRHLVDKHVFRKEPDFTIGSPDDPYLLRWYVIPKNRFLNIYLHTFCRPDDDRALHDHPWWNMSWVLKGSYVEIVPVLDSDPSGLTRRRTQEKGAVVFRRARQAHRVDLYRVPKRITSDLTTYRTCWTLFVTGPRFREWGFWCAKGWVHWEQYVRKVPGGSEIGVGCDTIGP